MGISFHAAAKAAEVGENEDVVEVPIDGKVYLARRPTVAQSTLLNIALAGQRQERLVAVFQIVDALLGNEARQIIERMIWERRIDFPDLIGGSDQNPEGGLIDQIFAEFAARPTEPSTDSSSSQTPGGRTSTGRSPGKGSIPSPSRSSNSSTRSTSGRRNASTPSK